MPYHKRCKQNVLRELQTNGKLRQGVDIDAVFHGSSDEPITLCGLRFNLFSFHKAQQSHVIILDAVGAHITGKNLTFPCEKSRLTSGTVRAKARTNRALASQISTLLTSCVPPSSQSIPIVPNFARFSSASNVFGDRCSVR